MPLLHNHFRSCNPSVSRLKRMIMDHPRSLRRFYMQWTEMLHPKLSTTILGSLCDSQFFWISLFYKCLIFMSVHNLFLIYNMSIDVHRSGKRRHVSFLKKKPNRNFNFFDRLGGWLDSLRPHSKTMKICTFFSSVNINFYCCLHKNKS